MNDATIALSFATKNFQVVFASVNEFKRKDIHGVINIVYPFDFEFSTLFSVDNMNGLASELSQKLRKEKVEGGELSVSLPINFAIVKRVALPLEADNKLLMNQVKWELNEYLSGKIDEYKVIRTDREYLYSNYKEWQFICIPHKILDNLNNLAENCGLSLKKIQLDQTSLENYLKKRQLIETNINRLIVKIDAYVTTSHLYVDNGYFLTYMDYTADTADGEAFNNQIINLVKNRYQQSLEKIDQLPFVAHQALQTFITGPELNEQLANQIRSQFKYELVTLPLDDDKYDEKKCGFAETLGVLYD